MELDRIFKYVDSKKEEIVNILCNLLAFDTSVPPGKNYPEICSYIADELSPLGFMPQEVEVSKEKLVDIPFKLEGRRINLVAKGPYKARPMSVYAHTDVVPAQSGWSHPPFKGTIAKDRVIGRGTIDMKGSIASFIFACKIMKKHGLEPFFNPIGLFCTDEEIGVYPGVYELAKRGLIEGPLLWLEGGGQWPYLLTASLGSAEIHIQINGKSSHVAMPFIGNNAVEKAIPILNALLEQKAKVEKKSSNIPMIFFPDQKLKPIFSITVISGGTKANIIPDKCNIIVDRRFISEETIKDIKEDIEKLLEGFNGLDFDCFHFYDPVKIDWNSPFHKKKIKALCAIHGLHQNLFVSGGMGGSTDMSFVKKVIPDIPIIGMGVMSPRSLGAHMIDESVHIDDLTGLCKEILYMFVAQ